MTYPTARLRQLTHVAVSNVDKLAVEGEMPVRVCNYTDVYYHDRITEELSFMEATATSAQIARFRLRAGDVIITKDSESPDDIAVPAFVPEDLDVVCGYHLAIIRPRLDLIDGAFLYYALASAETREQIGAAATGVTRFGLRLDSLGDVRVPIPGLHEQRRVAQFLDAELTRLDATRSQIETISRLLDERLKAATRHLLESSGSAWPVTALKRRWRVIDCKHRTPAYVDAGYPVVSPGDISPGTLSVDECTRFVSEEDFLELTQGERRIAKGDIVYSRNASVGIAAYVADDKAFTMGQDVCRITSATEDQRYLAHFLNSAGRDQLEAIQIGSTFSRVNIGQILDLQVPVPPVADQRRIADEIDRLVEHHGDLQASLRRQGKLLDERRRVLIAEAVTGRLGLEQAA